MATTYQQLTAELIGVYIKKNKVKQISDFVHATVKIRDNLLHAMKSSTCSVNNSVLLVTLISSDFAILRALNLTSILLPYRS